MGKRGFRGREMNIECPNCGGKLEMNPEFEDVWTYYIHCINCGRNYIIKIEGEK